MGGRGGPKGVENELASCEANDVRKHNPNWGRKWRAGPAQPATARIHPVEKEGPSHVSCHVIFFHVSDEGTCWHASCPCGRALVDVDAFIEFICISL